MVVDTSNEITVPFVCRNTNSEGRRKSHGYCMRTTDGKQNRLRINNLPTRKTVNSYPYKHYNKLLSLYHYLFCHLYPLLHVFLEKLSVAITGVNSKLFDKTFSWRYNTDKRSNTELRRKIF